MKTGLLERILTRRYGKPELCIRDGMAAKHWDTGFPNDEALLYAGKWPGILAVRFASLKEIYGDTYGGFLFGDSLRAANLLSREIYALWNMDEFRVQPEVQHALVLDPAVDYFMDSFNIYFYGIKRGQLYVYDAGTDEFDSLGPIEAALEERLDELETATRDIQR
jgi:hypothetical protein